MPLKNYGCVYCFILVAAGTLALSLSCNTLSAQTVEVTSQAESTSLTAQIPPNIPQNLPTEIIPRDRPPSIIPLPPPEIPSPLPPPDQLLQPAAPAPLEPEPDVPQTVDVQKFEVQGSTVFDSDELAALAWQAARSDSNLEISDLVASYCSSRSSDEAEPSRTPETPGDRCCPHNIDPTNLQSSQPPIPLSFDSAPAGAFCDYPALSQL